MVHVEEASETVAVAVAHDCAGGVVNDESVETAGPIADADTAVEPKFC